MTYANLLAAFTYNPGTGHFIRRYACGSMKRVGKVDGKGYIRFDYQGHTYAAHRLAFLYMTGVMPSLQIDHINGDRADNRWSNMRLATPSQNTINSNSKLGVAGMRGVSRMQWGDRVVWQARIQANGKRIQLGYYNNKDEAYQAYRKAALVYHGPYSSLDRA